MDRFFSYYGSKKRAAQYYPAPRHDTIIEPFAGSAGYSMLYYYKKVILCDLDPVIFGIWDYLIRISPANIRRLPDFPVADLSEYKGLCQEERWLIGFLINHGRTRPSKKSSSWMQSGERPKSFWGPEKKELIASQVELIKHWKVVEASYEDLVNKEATWFVDPPYVRSGEAYEYNRIDYEHLASWVRCRLGDAIVCEQEGADWLPFKTLGSLQGTPSAGFKTELIYYQKGPVV